MFDLFRSRDKAVRYLLGGLLTIVALSMVTYLIPGYGSTSGLTQGDDNVIADVGNQKITEQEIRTAIDRLTSTGQLPSEMASGYVPQYVNQVIQQHAVSYEFERLGLTISDEEVLEGLMSIMPQFFQNGALTSKEQLEAFLQQQNMTLNDAVDLMRNQLMLRKVQNMALSGIVVSPQEVDRSIVEKHQKATIEYILFAPAKFRDQVKVTPEQLKQAFEEHRGDYRIPEKFSYQVLVIDQAKVEETMTVSDAQLHQAYSSSMDSFRLPERVKVRHILLSTVNKSDAEKKQILTKANDLLKQIKAGGDFAELAKKNSEDPGSAPNGGELGWVVRGQTVPEFETAAFSLKPKEFSNIITTQYGYHILQVEDKEAARVKPFEEVKADLADSVKKQSVNDKVQSIADGVHAALEKSPASAADVAKQFGAELVTVNKANAGEAIPSLGVSPEINAALAGMKSNDVSQILVLPANRLAVVVMKDRTPSTQAEFAEVEGQVRERYLADQSGLLATAAAKQAGERIRAGEDMEKVAKSMKLDLAKPPEFGRADSVEGLGQAGSIADTFTRPVGSVVGPEVTQGRTIIFKILNRTEVDPKQFAAEKEATLLQLRQQKATDRNELMLDSVVATLTAEGKVKVHKEAFNRLLASYLPQR